MNNNNLPMKINNNLKLSIIQKRKLKRIQEGLKRIGTIGIDGLVDFVGLIAWIAGDSIVNPTIGAIVSTIGMATMIGASYEVISNSMFKRNNDMMFVTRRKLNGEISIWQELVHDLKFLHKIKDYNPREKAAVMGLQNLVRTSKI